MRFTIIFLVLLSALFTTSCNESTSIERAEEKQIDKKNEYEKRLSGKWAGRWGTTRNPVTVEIPADMKGITISDSRYLMLGQKYENLEFVLLDDDRMILLGWAVSKGRDPFTDQPDHVAIMRREQEDKAAVGR